MNPNIGSRYWTHFIEIFDFVLLPIYLLLIYAIAYSIRNKNYSTRHPWHKYFITGFSLKIFGAIFIGLIYEYYYHGGDTSAFFYHGKVINQSLSDSVVKWINLLFHIPNAYDIDYYQYINQMRWYGNPSSYVVSALTAFISLFTFNTYLPATVLFAALSFSGTWAMFRTFAEQYPKLIPQLALCILFIPSTFVWGSGIFKDTVCMACLGWLTFAAFRIIIRKQFRWRYFFIAFLCIYLLAIIKIYIVLVFLPALVIWLLNTYSGAIRNTILRTGLRLSIYGGIAVAFLFVSSSFSKELGQYSLENIAETSNITRSYIYWVSTEGSGEEGSAYDLGAFDPTFTGMLTKFPLAVNVTLFRPYLWEARKPIVFLNAIEAFLFLFFTLKVLFSVGLRKTWKSISKSPNIQFFLVYSIIFAFAVGISSYNFGTLSRYRIPCLPFYAMALVLIYYNNKPLQNKFFSMNFK
jgi:hypothetical protein